MTLVSIIIPTKDRVELLQKCLDGAIRGLNGVNCEIILVDNGSQDPATYKYYNGLIGPIKIVNANGLTRFSEWCNFGAKEAKGDYLLFLNNDTIPTEGWISELLRTHKKWSFIEKAGCVGGKMLFPDGRIQHIGQMLRYHDHVPTHLYYGRRPDEPQIKEVVETERRVVGITGACMLVKKTTFDEVGGFDINYKNGFEDVDLCFKLKEKGYAHFYTPKCLVYHSEHGTLPTDSKRDAENIQYLFSKWGNKIKKVEQP